MTRGRATGYTETDIKRQIKDVLAFNGIFNYPLVQGLRSYRGVPDRVMHLKGKVVYLEVKKPGNRQSENQVKFQAQCQEDGIDYFVVHSPEEVMEIIAEVLRE